MATNEGLVFDGLDLNTITGTYALESFAAPPPKKRVEWAQGADADGAALVRDPLFDTRELTFSVRVLAASMDAALAAVGALSDKIEEAEKTPGGLALVWTPATGTKSLTFYVLTGEISDLPIDPTSGYFANAPIVSVSLTAQPFGYGAEVVLTAATGSVPVLTTTIPNVPGDVPAEGRIIVADTATQNRYDVEWGLEQRYYDATQSLVLDSDSLTTTGTAGVPYTAAGSYAGAYDPNASGTNAISTVAYTYWQAMAATGNLAHIGTYRVKARMAGALVAGSLSDYRARFTYRVGDGPYVTLPSVLLPDIANRPAWTEIDLGLITLAPVASGTQRWNGFLEISKDSGSAFVVLDYLALVPAGEGYGRARAPATFATGSMILIDSAQPYAVGIAMTTTSPGSTASGSGAWLGAGSATDFTRTAGGGWQRVTTADAAGTGRTIYLSGANTNTGDMLARLKFAGIDTTMSGKRMIYARYSTTGPAYVRGGLNFAAPYVYLQIEASGGFSRFLRLTSTAVLSTSFVGSIELATSAVGHYRLRLLDSGGGVLAELAGQTSAIASTAIGAGTPGFYDEAQAGGTRAYTEMWAYTTVAQSAVIFSGRAMQIRSDGAIRQSSDGSTYGDVPVYRGSRFLLPPAGAANRTSRIYMRAARQDLTTGEFNPATDGLSVQVAYTPRYLAVPR